MLFKIVQTPYTNTSVVLCHCLAAAEVQRNANSVCCAERVQARLKYPHFQSSFEIVYDFKIQRQP